MSKDTQYLEDDELREISDYIRRADEVGLDAEGNIYAYIAGPKDGMGQHYDPTNINITRLIKARDEKLLEEAEKFNYELGYKSAVNDLTLTQSPKKKGSE